MNNVSDRLKIQLNNFVQVMHEHGATRRYIWEQLHNLVDGVVDLEPGEIFEPFLEDLVLNHAGDVYQRLAELMLQYRSHFERDLFTADLTRHLISFSIDRSLNNFYEPVPIDSVNMEIETDDTIAISPL